MLTRKYNSHRFLLLKLFSKLHCIPDYKPSSVSLILSVTWTRPVLFLFLRCILLSIRIHHCVSVCFCCSETVFCCSETVEGNYCLQSEELFCTLPLCLDPDISQYPLPGCWRWMKPSEFDFFLLVMELYFILHLYIWQWVVLLCSGHLFINNGMNLSGASRLLDFVYMVV